MLLFSKIHIGEKMFNLNKVVLFFGILNITACVSHPYSNPTDLQFQKKQSSQSQKLMVIRDEKLCANDQEDSQNCPINFYIDNIKSGGFFIKNTATYKLNNETYHFSAKNCTDECHVCETDLNVSEIKDNTIFLTVDEKGLPKILNAEKQNLCKAPTATIAEPQKEQTVEVNLSADTLFKFDGAAKKDLLVEGHQQILDVANKISTGFATVSRIQLIGHTDRLGSQTYNQKLGQSRAETVQSILIENGISKNIIDVSSVGKNEPITDGCRTVEAGQALKDCLQPDRRVAVKITGISK